jgi:pyruvate dehydrogenase E1 component beta subunit
MKRDPNVILLGEDVRYDMQGTSTGLVEEFGKERVMDMPISEAGFTGMALGAAMAGLRPVLEYEIVTMPYLAMDQIVDQIMKIRYMTAGQVEVPLTIRCVLSGAGRGHAGQHSDHPYPMLLKAGLKVVVPTTPYDAKGLLKTSIRGDDPVVIFESARVMGTKGEVPEEEYTIPLGKAEIRRKGGDVTIVAVGYLVQEAVVAANGLSKAQGIECEVIDPRSLHPLDREAILESVSKTGRLVVADDSNRTCGFAAEVSALVVEETFHKLKAPVKRVTRGGYVVPFAPNLEAAVLPDAVAIKGTVEKLLGITPSVVTSTGNS